MARVSPPSCRGSRHGGRVPRNSYSMDNMVHTCICIHVLGGGITKGHFNEKVDADVEMLRDQWLRKQLELGRKRGIFGLSDSEFLFHHSRGRSALFGSANHL